MRGCTSDGPDHCCVTTFRRVSVRRLVAVVAGRAMNHSRQCRRFTRIGLALGGVIALLIPAPNLPVNAPLDDVSDRCRQREKTTCRRTQ